MGRRKKVAEHINHDRWLVSYADFITLLFAFFVVLFSSAQVDKRKVGKISVAMQEAFQHMGMFPTGNSTTPVVTVNPLSAENIQIIGNGKGFPDRHNTAATFEKIAGATLPDRGLVAVQTQLASALAPEIRRHEVVLSATPEGLVVSLREVGFFDSGSPELRTTAEAAVGRIAKLLNDQSNNIRIEGHTDNVPIHNAQYTSNWELSTARATEMIRLFITRYNIPASRLSAAGYAEYHPVSGNLTAEGRAQNRRVDIVVLAGPRGSSTTSPVLISPVR